MYSDFYEIPLPALRFEKTEEIDKTDKSENDIKRKERRLPNRPRKNQRRQKITTLIHSKESQKDDTQGTKQRFQNRGRHAAKNVNKRFQVQHAEQRLK